MSFSRSLLLMVVSCCVFGGVPGVESTRTARAQEDALLKKFPSSANALMVIDVDGLLASELAKKESWGDATNPHYAERPLDLPKLAKRIAVASQLRSDEDLSRVWELAVMELKEPVPLRSIALREGGYVDEVGGTPAVWTPSDTYFVALGETMLGAMYPANRQFVSQWATKSQSNQLLKLSDYLLQVAAHIKPGSQIAMGIDLQDAVQPHTVRASLEGLEVLSGKEDQIQQIAALMTGLKGVTLNVDVAAGAQGTIRVDFSDDAGALGNLAKPLFLEVLRKFDAEIPDLESWDAELLGNTLVLSGPLSTGGLRRIGSLLSPPSTKFSELKDAAPVESGTDTAVKASQDYYRSVAALINDLRVSLTKTRDNHATWMERYARKIDGLPILNVDPDLLTWGASIAATFRSMSVTSKTANVSAGTSKAYVNTGVSYSGYGYGSGGWYTANDATGAAKQKYQIDRTYKGQATIEGFSSWKEVEDSAAEMRIAMTQKYNVEF